MRRIRRGRGQRGNAVLELAIIAPVMLVLCMGAADFGRMFYHVITLIDSANVGATYGALRAANSGKFDTMESMAEQAASDISRQSAVEATAVRYCDCPDNPASGPTDTDRLVDCFTGSCSSYGDPRVYVQVRVEQGFSTIADYPGIAQSRELRPAAYRRVQ